MYACAVNYLSEMEMNKRLQQVERVTSSAVGDKKTTAGSSSVSGFVTLFHFDCFSLVVRFAVIPFPANTVGWMTGRASNL